MSISFHRYDLPASMMIDALPFASTKLAGSLYRHVQRESGRAELNRLNIAVVGIGWWLLLKGPIESPVGERPDERTDQAFPFGRHGIGLWTVDHFHRFVHQQPHGKQRQRGNPNCFRDLHHITLRCEHVARLAVAGGCGLHPFGMV